MELRFDHSWHLGVRMTCLESDQNRPKIESISTRKVPRTRQGVGIGTKVYKQKLSSTTWRVSIKQVWVTYERFLALEN